MATAMKDCATCDDCRWLQAWITSGGRVRYWCVKRKLDLGGKDPSGRPACYDFVWGQTPR